jgi:dihydropteroate synthase type 2
MEKQLPGIVGIVNITEDSFSDGGRYLAPEDALGHARGLAEDGADVVELGPASTHPDAKAISAAQEIQRLTGVLPPLVAAGITVAVDSFQVETQSWALEHGAAYLNDTQGFPEPEAVRGLAQSSARLIAMHSVQRRGKAVRRRTDPGRILEEVETFFAERLEVLARAGVARERVILDPGMGFFLGSNPEPSLRVLTELPRLRSRFGLPLLVSISRKSFVQRLAGRDASNSGAATLAAELFAARAGADYIRTHDVAALRDALRVSAALEA